MAASTALELPVSSMRTALTAIRPGGKALRAGEESLPDERLAGLSPREQQIVRLVAKGYVNNTIGRVLDISPWTVSTHLRRIFAKLGVASRAAMIAALYAADPPPSGPGER
jgi:DNA-binding CsgD family transcriptional regulator